MAGGMDRRSFLRRSGATGLFLAPSLQGLAALARPDARPSSGPEAPLLPQPGYGELVQSRDCPEMALPEGFRCAKLSEAGWPMANGQPTPNAFDGMAAFPISGNTIRLVRNHELRNRPPQGTVLADRAYDDVASGGTTTFEVRVNPDGSAEMVSEWASLAGTLVNCAGGPTPWGSWLSCEETTSGRSNGGSSRMVTCSRYRHRPRVRSQLFRIGTWAASCTRRWLSIRRRAASTRQKIA